MTKGFIQLLLIISLGGYILIGYFLERSHFTTLISVYGGLFLIYFYILHYKAKLNPQTGIIAGLIFRLALLFSLPVLSDDFYRFLWDGHIQQLGFNPFAYTPRQLLAQNQDSYLEQLFPYLNSPDYFSVYPQLLQWIFRLCSYVAGDHILQSAILLKSVLFAFECGSIYLLHKLLSINKINPDLIFLYTLNPLVIIELIGNIHFEAIMIFFILLTAWLIQKQKYIPSAGALSLAIQAKLIPFIAIPLLIRKIGWGKTIFYGVLCLLLFWLLNPFMWTGAENYQNFLSSLKLYYGKFEFNGSIYSIFRAAGWWLLGYNPIAWLSKIMLVLSLAAFLFIYKQKLSFLRGCFWLLLSYLAFSAVVHPWYLAALVALSPFVNYRFALIWTALAPLSYITYQTLPYQQNYWMIALEYGIVFLWMIYEMRNRKFAFNSLI